MGEYDRQVATALRLIKKKGRKVTWRSITGADSLKPWQGDVLTEVDYEVDMVFIPVDRTDHDTLLVREFSDKVIGFETGYMGQVPFEPTLKDLVIVDGVPRTPYQITCYNPNGQKILYDVQFLL